MRATQGSSLVAIHKKFARVSRRRYTNCASQADAAESEATSQGEMEET
jgi:hypothetical protein